MQHLTTETVIDYLHGALPPGEDAVVLAHLALCESCGAELAIEAALSERLRSNAAAEELELPLGMKSAILARLAAEKTAPRWYRPAILIPLVGAVAVAAGLFFSPAVHRPGAAPEDPVPIAYLLEEHAAHAQENPLSDRSAAAMMTASFGRTPETVSAPLIQTVNASSMREASSREAALDAAGLADNGAR